jgi:hypothetical protein
VSLGERLAKVKTVRHEQDRPADVDAVDPDDPIAVARQKERHQMIDEYVAPTESFEVGSG